MSSDDEDLKRAIAQSLAEYKTHASKDDRDPIVISSDDEPELDPKPSIPHASPHSTTAVAPKSRTSPVGATNAFLSERAQLEAARLTRLKHMREPGPSSKPKRALDDPFVSSDEEERPPTKKSKFSASSVSYNGSTNVASSSSLAAGTGKAKAGVMAPEGSNGKFSEISEKDQLFWTGEVRQTANMHVDKTRDTRPVFRLSNILGNLSDLTFCILSSYVTQLSWIYSLLPPSLPVILVAQPGEDGAADVHNVLPNWVKVSPALRGGRGCMHIKLILLFYKSGRARIAIPTANLVDYDWRDIENSVWLQDIPPRPHAVPRDPKADDFGAHIEKVLEALNVREGLKAIRVDHPDIPLRSISDLRCGWDFRKFQVRLVASLAGKHEGWPAVLRVGHTRLMRVVRDIGARVDGNAAADRKGKGKRKAKNGNIERQVALECQTSSIGLYTPAWLDEFFGSARGASPEAWLDDTKARRTKDVEARVKREGWPELKILFPTLKTVQASRLGEDGAGTMFCQRRQWTALKFPRELFHDSNSRRGPVLMHSKMIIATLQDATPSSSSSKAKLFFKAPSKRRLPSPDSDSSVTELSSDSSEVEEIDPERNADVIGWAYVGSHNFTPSAWGRLSGSSFTPVLDITNYELGVVFALKDPSQADQVACWERPPRKYDLDTDQPWIQTA